MLKQNLVDECCEYIKTEYEENYVFICVDAVEKFGIEVCRESAIKLLNEVASRDEFDTKLVTLLEIICSLMDMCLLSEKERAVTIDAYRRARQS